jgi:hypothetical protein
MLVVLGDFVQGEGADIIVTQRSTADSVNTHHKLAGRVRTDHASVCFHPVGGVVKPLFGGQEGEGRLEGIKAKGTAVRQGQFATTQKEAVTDSHGTSAVAIDAFNHNS